MARRLRAWWPIGGRIICALDVWLAGNDRVALEDAAKYAAFRAHGGAVDGYRLPAGYERHHRSDFFRSFEAFQQRTGSASGKELFFHVCFRDTPLLSHLLDKRADAFRGRRPRKDG